MPYQLARLLAVCVVTIPSLVSAAGNTVSDTANLDTPLHRSWPAGPGTQVDTSTGVLQTSVPLFSLTGPGRSSMGFGLYRRSNQFNATLAPVNGYTGAGWEPSTMNYVYAGGPDGGGGTVFTTTPYQVIGGNAANHWSAQNVGSGGLPPSPIVRRPGIRADLSPVMSGSTVTGWVVTEQADAVKYYYMRHDGAQQGGVFEPLKWYLTSVVDPRGNTVAYSYNSDNHVTSIQDAAGRVATLAWDAGANGLLRSVGVSAGGQTRTWSLQYTARTGHQPWLQNVVFPANQDGVQPTLHFEYDLANDNITDIFDPRGADWHYTYGGTTWGTLVVGGVYEPSKTLPANYNYTNPPLNTYDTASPTVFYYASNISGSDLTATAGSYTYTLPSYRMDCAIIDRLGKLWRHEYDYGVDGSQQSGIINNEWLGNPIRKVVQPAVTDYNGNANTLYSDSYTWDYNQGTLTTHIDPAGRKTDFTYDLTPRDNSGLVRTMTRYTGGSAYTWQYGNWYLPGAQPRRVVTNDPDGRRTVTGYNWNYDEATYVDVDPKTDPYDASYSKPTGLHLQTNSTYNAQGELTDVWTGSDPHAVSSNFDAYGNARTVTDPAGGVTTLTFDAWGNKRSQTGPSPLGETDFYYDNLDRLYETDLPDGHRVQAGHDLNGNATSVTKEGGTTVTTAYDGLNRPTSASNPLGDSTTLTTSYGYNLRGERTSVTNPRGYITYYGFDARGKLTLVTYPATAPTTRRPTPASTPTTAPATAPTSSTDGARRPGTATTALVA